MPFDLAADMHSAFGPFAPLELKDIEGVGLYAAPKMGGQSASGAPIGIFNTHYGAWSMSLFAFEAIGEVKPRVPVGVSSFLIY